MAAEGRPFGVRRGTLPGLAATAGALPLARARRRRGLGACAVLARPLLAALVLLAAANVASAQPSPLDDATLSRYPLDWNLVPLTPSNATNLTANCICDLRQDACDLGCCCDPVCTPGLVGLFEDSGRCLPEGPPSQTLSFCVPSGNVFTVRPRGRAGVKVASWQCNAMAWVVPCHAGGVGVAHACSLVPACSAQPKPSRPPSCMSSTGQPAVDQRLLRGREAARRPGVLEPTALHRVGQQPGRGVPVPRCARAERLCRPAIQLHDRPLHVSCVAWGREGGNASLPQG